MADSTSTPSPSTSNNASTVAYSSYFGHMVCLYDWWLIKAESYFKGKWLAVSGMTSRKEKAVRVFVSAPIAKRYDQFSLETADGIYIMIKGFINEQRTRENGLPPEVFNNFLFGFPPNWESFAVDWFGHESTAGIDLGSDVPENVSPIDPEDLSDGVEKPIPTLSKSPEEALPICEVNVSHGNDSKRRAKTSHKVKIFKQNKPASGVAQKHPNKEQNSALGALENPGGVGLESPMASVQLQSLGGQVNTYTPPKQLVKNSSSAIGLEVLSDVKSIPNSKFPEETLGTHEKSFPTEEFQSSKETTGKVGVAHGRGRNTRSTRLHNIKVCKQKKPAYEGSQKHLDKEQHSSSGTFGNPDGEGWESPMTTVQSQSPSQVNTLSKKIIKNSGSRMSRTFSANEPCLKKQKVTIETSRITSKRKKSGTAFANKYPQERDANPLIKEGNEKIFSVSSPLSSSIKKSRSGRLLLPPLEFWRNQIPIYDAEHEIKENREGGSLNLPLKGSSRH